MNQIQALKQLGETQSWFGSSEGIPDKVFYAEQLINY